MSTDYPFQVGARGMHVICVDFPVTWWVGVKIIEETVRGENTRLNQ